MSGGGTPRVLVVCTANVCRSPVVERLLARHLHGAGIDADVSSAGTHGGRNVVHPDTFGAARRQGIDLDDHQSRRATHRLLRTDGTDLIVTMTREHVCQIVALDETTWPRIFTLPELARRSADLGSDLAPVTFGAWVEALGADRTSTDLLLGGRADDVRDPYGRAARHHRAMVAQVDRLCASTADHAARVIGSVDS